MAEFTKQIRINLDLGQNQLSSVIIEKSASAPAGATKVGYIYFDTELAKFGVLTAVNGDTKTWEYMASVADLTAKLNDMRDSLTLTKVEATGVKVGITAGDTTKEATVFFDGLVTNVAYANAEPGATPEDEPTPGDYLVLTKSGNDGIADEVSYVKIAQTVESGALVHENEKLSFTKTDGSTFDVSLADLYTAIASKTVGIANTDSIEMSSEVDPNTHAQTLSADVVLSSNSAQALSIVHATQEGDDHGLLVKKVDALSAAGADLTALATGQAVVDALADEAFKATTSARGNIQLANSDEAIAGNDTEKAITPATLHAAIAKNIQGGVTYIGVLPVKEGSDPAELPDDFTAEKGDLFYINANRTVGNTELHTGDYVLFNADATTSTVEDKFDVINSELAEDVVRKDAAQTLTNKHIDADDNEIVDLKMTNLAAAVADFASTETTDAAKAAAQVASKAKVEEMIAASVANVKVDDVTIQNIQGELSLKDGGITTAKINSSAMSTAIDATGVDTKLATEKAVRDLYNEIAGDTMTLTNKSFDANGTGNSLSNVETDDFASGVIQTSVRDIDTASDSALATEKAVRAELDGLNANALEIKAVDLTFTDGVDDAAGTASATVTLSAAGFKADHLISSAKVIDNNGNEVECLISYNMNSGSLIIKVNGSAPSGWKAIIVA